MAGRTSFNRERKGTKQFYGDRDPEPISVRVPEAIALTGFSRSRLYELIASGEVQIAKDGRTTLILVASLREAVMRRLVATEER